jgi:hypothetical protein
VAARTWLGPGRFDSAAALELPYVLGSARATAFGWKLAAAAGWCVRSATERVGVVPAPSRGRAGDSKKCPSSATRRGGDL